MQYLYYLYNISCFNMRCFTQCKCVWILLRDIIIILLLYSDKTCASNVKNAIQLAGVVENITVYALEDVSYFGNNNSLKSLKLNISWMPSNEGRQPYSYSVTVTSMPKETDTDRIECIEGSESYIVQNKSPFNLLVPQNHTSEMQIRPTCTYKVQVYANPSAKPVGKLPEVVYTVPECIGQKCSCAAAKVSLPVPKVKLTQAKKNVIINWNITSNNSHVHSYVISIGTPLLTSKAGHSVYNITKISNVTSATNTFVWNFKINDQYVKVKNGYEIYVAAMDYRGCSGTQGNFTIINADKTQASIGIIWLLFASVVTCVILGFASIVLIRNKNGPSRLAQWPRSVFQRLNVGVYAEQRFEEVCYKSENDEFEMPYECINFMHELGKGQFGRVYLGSLNNNNKNTLIAVKMSQCSDESNEPEVRRQLLEEIKIMKAAGSHPHLVNLIGCCTLPDNPICILLEYMEGGDLLAHLHSRRNIDAIDAPLCNFEKTASGYININIDQNKNVDSYSTIEKQQFMKFALDIARGMKHLEAKEITHRDLAARNILLTADFTLKISDFGLSRNGIYVIKNVAGKVRQLPIRWMSPEAVRDRAFSSKSDVWSFGIVLWEIGTLGSFPYANVQDDELLHYLTQDKCRLSCSDAISHDIYQIMCSCWNAVPQDRPSFAQLVLDLQTLKDPLHSAHETSNPCYTLLSHKYNLESFDEYMCMHACS